MEANDGFGGKYDREFNEVRREIRQLWRALLLLAMLFAVIGLVVAFGAGDAGAADKWSKGDIGREIAWEVLHVIDWGQTRDISKRYDEGYYEAGPAKIFIGNKPDTSQVDIYMALSALLHPVITHYLPREGEILEFRWRPRETWQWVSIGMSAGCVARNVSIGLKVNF